MTGYPLEPVKLRKSILILLAIYAGMVCVVCIFVLGRSLVTEGYLMWEDVKASFVEGATFAALLMLFLSLPILLFDWVKWRLQERERRRREREYEQELLKASGFDEEGNR